MNDYKRKSPSLGNEKLTHKDISFDPTDEISFYFGNLNRDDVKDFLGEAPIGTFLIRDSTKEIDHKVLCVKEAPKCINNYKIVYRQNPDETHVFFIHGKEDLMFESIAKVLEFYSTHYLNQSPLIQPAFYHKKCLALFDFQENGDPNEDLYFKKGEILTILEYTQGEQWWKASNSKGDIGLVPVTLIRRIKPFEWPLIISNKQSQTTSIEQSKPIDENKILDKSESEKPAIVNEQETLVVEEVVEEFCSYNAKVVEDYTPSAYEYSYISLRVGQIVKVLEMKSTGKLFGQLVFDGKKWVTDGKKGLFPFNSVVIIRE